MPYTMAAIRLADSVREEITPYSFVEWAYSPATPRESIQAMPQAVTSAASEPPFRFPIIKGDNPLTAKSWFAFLSRAIFCSVNSIAGRRLVCIS